MAAPKQVQEVRPFPIKVDDKITITINVDESTATALESDHVVALELLKTLCENGQLPADQFLEAIQNALKDLKEPQNSSAHGFRWTDSTVKLLLSLVQETKAYEQRQEKRKHVIWREISEKMLAEGHNVSWENVAKKFANLLDRYKVIKDKSSKSGGFSKWPYYDIIDEMLNGNDPRPHKSTLVTCSLSEKPLTPPVSSSDSIFYTSDDSHLEVEPTEILSDRTCKRESSSDSSYSDELEVSNSPERTKRKKTAHDNSNPEQVQPPKFNDRMKRNIFRTRKMSTESSEEEVVVLPHTQERSERRRSRQMTSPLKKSDSTKAPAWLTQYLQQKKQFQNEYRAEYVKAVREKAAAINNVAEAIKALAEAINKDN